jgi:parvulin-like peptidyl-prolyl isomerase
VAWQGAVKALPNVRRTQVEAKARAEEVRARALAGEDFADLARRYSDDSTASRGGTLGGFDHGVMVRSFEDALRTLKVGAISEVVESPFGYHVIRRDALTEVHGAHLMVSWSGAERAPEGVTRTKEEARARAEAALAAVNAGREWGRVVAEFSDGPLKDDDGDLGWLARGQLARPLDQAMFDLDIAATSALIETPRGFHILRRLE